MIITATNNASTISGVSINGSTMDVLTYVQALLLQDADSQLKDMGKSMQANLALKKAYRNDISKLEIALNKVKTDGKGDDGKKKIVDGSTNPDPQPFLDSMGLGDGAVNNYNYDTEAKNGLGEIIASPNSDLKLVETLENGTNEEGLTVYKHTITEGVLDTAIKHLTNKMDNLTTEGEQLNLRLQDLAGKRKTTLETLSSLISKVQDASASIIRNIAK